MLDAILVVVHGVEIARAVGCVEISCHVGGGEGNRGDLPYFCSRDCRTHGGGFGMGCGVGELADAVFAGAGGRHESESVGGVGGFDAGLQALAQCG